MNPEKKPKPAYDFGVSKAPWISDEHREVLYEEDIKRGVQTGRDFCAFMDLGHALMNAQKNIKAAKEEFSKKDLQERIASIIGSPGIFGRNAGGIDQEFKFQLCTGIGEAVLAHFYHELPNLDKLIECTVPEIDPWSKKDEKLEVSHYFISDTLQIREWERAEGLGAGIYHTLDMKDAQGKLIERVSARNGEISKWERLHYDNNGNVDTYVEINFLISFPSVKVLKFKDKQLSEAKEINFYSDDSGTFARLVKPTDKEGKWAIVSYSNSKVRSIEHGSELTSEMPFRGSTGWINSVGLSDQNPSKETGYHQDSEGSWIGTKYSRQWDWSKSNKKDKNGRKIWKQMKFGYDSTIVLSKIGDGKVELKRPDKAKAEFPLEVDLKDFQQTIAQEGFYKI